MKAIVTTTISPPTEATLKFQHMEGWTLIVVGDRKTPHDAYKDLNCVYLHPDQQDREFKELSDTIGWNCIQRRNVGFAWAYHNGAEIVATVDDDNIPLENWSDELVVGTEIECQTYDCSAPVFDALSVTNSKAYWHRGFPLEMVPQKNEVVDCGKEKMFVHVQANLWNGHPDIDAIQRIAYQNPRVEFPEVTGFYRPRKISPFNSQNTYLTREALRRFMCIPHVGRMDDIWGAYLVQRELGAGTVAYGPATVIQERHPHQFVTDLEKEVIGYRHSGAFIRGDFRLPEPAYKALAVYRKTMGLETPTDW